YSLSLSPNGQYLEGSEYCPLTPPPGLSQGERELLFAFHRSRNRGFCQRRHNRVPTGVRVQSILAQLSFQKTFVIDHGGIVIQVRQLIPTTVRLHPFVQRHDFLRRPADSLDNWFTVSLLVIAHRQDRREDYLDRIHPGQLSHGGQVVFDCLE